ncbi:MULTISPECIES: RHS repeat domain-containing protein [Cysteiniphilum]|nr:MULTISPECIES: RHS repeat domain-containing protein [Cysteiniphilum]
MYYNKSILGLMACLGFFLSCANATTSSYDFSYATDHTNITLPLGEQKTVYYHSFHGRKLIDKVEQSTPDGKHKKTTQYVYDAAGYPQKVIFANGSITETNYSADGLLAAKTAFAHTPLSLTTHYTWSDRRLPLTISSSNGLDTVFSYNTRQRPLTITTTDGHIRQVWQYTYDDHALVLTAQSPFSDPAHVIQYTHDAQGNLSKVVNELGHVTTYDQYDEVGDLLSKTDANGVRTTLSYSPMRLLLTQHVADHLTRYSYDGNRHLSSITSAEGIKTQYVYNYWKDLKEVINANNDQLKQTIDPMGNVIERVIIDSSGNTVFKISYAYNSLNQLQSITDANGNSTSFEYDISGNVIKTTNAKGDATNNQYNIQKKVAQTKNALSSVSNMTYDPSGNVTSISDYNGNITNYQYNAFNQLTEVNSPDKGKTVYNYNDKGQLSTQTDANGITLGYAYDQLNRVTEVSHNSTPVIQYGYDQGQYGIGRLSSVKNQSSEIDNSYDAFGGIIKQRYIIDGNPYDVSYSYNKDEVVSSITYPSGLQVNFTRDKVGNINGITASDKGTQSTIASNVSYLPFGAMKSLSFGNGSQLTRTYDKAYQLTQQTVSGVADDSYVYDKLGNITRFVSKDDPTKSKDYAYDAIERLTSMKSQLETQNFSYDANGNRLTYTNSKDGQTEAISYQYDKATNKLQSYQDTTANGVSYDNNGNITRLGDMRFSYDVFNNLTEVKKDNKGSHESKESKEIASYQYSPNNQRVLKTVNGNKTVFIYDITGKLIEVRSKDTLIDIIYLNGEPIAQLVNGATYYFVNDALGTPEYLTGQNGQKQWSGNINPFAVNATGQVQQDIRFSGQLNDSETGLVYNNARAYVPFLGRYLQADPLGLASGSLNNYVYVGNNPVNLVDPMGLSAMDHVRNFANGFDDTTSFGLTNFGADKGYSLSYNIGSFAAMTAGIFYGATEVRAFNALRQMLTPRAVSEIEQATKTGAICANGAENIATYSKLKNQLKSESASSPFTSTGGLTSAALNNSNVIYYSAKLKNPSIPKGFGKYKTETFQSASGDFKVHYYTQLGKQNF